MPELMPVDAFTWRLIVARCLLGSTVKAVAYAMNNYADPDGSNVRPGEPRLVKDTELGLTTVRAGTAKLREVGLLDRVSIGSSFGRAQKADVYRLTTPGLEELNNLVPMWNHERTLLFFKGKEIDPPEPKARAKRKKAPAGDAGVQGGESAASPAGDAGGDVENPGDNSASPAGDSGVPTLPAGNHRQELTGTPAGDAENTGRSYRLPSHRPSHGPSQDSNTSGHGAEVEGSTAGHREPSAEIDHPHGTSRFDFASASAYLLTLDDVLQAAAIERAEAILGPDADRVAVLIHAAEALRTGSLA